MKTSTDPIGGRGSPEERLDRPHEVSSLVDWGVSAVLTLVGLILAVSSWLLYTEVDRGDIQAAVDAESLSIEWLSPSELVDAAVPFVEWVAIGIGAAGTMLIAGGIGFALIRWRTRKHVSNHGGTTGTSTAHSMYGAVAGALLSFVPLSTALGGAVAGYLRNGCAPSGTKVGALSGVLGSVPIATILTGVIVGGVASANAIGEGAAGTAIAGAGLILLFVVVLINTGLGALGGALGKRI